MLGVDAREHEAGRSDTLIYTVIRPKDGNVLMLSIPRDRRNTIDLCMNPNTSVDQLIVPSDTKPAVKPQIPA
jgi:anionic cell wall polymer biosynthesis LytR-Cps2A-Psr (LCP) family protein